MRIVFFGTSNVALPILEKLYQHHDIAAVVTMPDSKVGRSQELSESPVAVLANEMELNILKPESVKGNQGLVAELQNLNADIFVVVSYGKIMPKEVIAMPRLGMVNVHFSMLPKYRGASPIQSALLAGEQQTGTTIFLLDEKVDNGPILAQESVIIDPDDNFITLGDKLARISARLLLNALPEYEKGLTLPKPQNDSEATFTSIIDREHGKIDWQKTAQEIYNQFRAYYPWPGIWTTWKGNNLKILDCVPTGLLSQDSPGTVSENGIVACGNETTLKISSLQLEGKTQTNISNFLNGYKDFVGSKLGQN